MLDAQVQAAYRVLQDEAEQALRDCHTLIMAAQLRYRNRLMRAQQEFNELINDRKQLEGS